MLREILNVRQVPGERNRRWFTSATVDLVVWCNEAGAPVGFQLCYDKGGAERALTWHPESGFSHMAVDSGEEKSGIRYKSTPILIADGLVDTDRISLLMQQNKHAVPDDVANFVNGKIRECLGVNTSKD